MNKITKEVVWYATVAALVFAARLLDHVVTGWFPINAAVVTLAVVFACIFIRPSLINAFAVGLVFGIMSLITSVMFPGAFTVYFVNPLVSVLPRVIASLCVYAGFVAVRRMLGEKKTSFFVGGAAACIVGAVVNTVTVMSMIYLFRTGNQAEMAYLQIIGLVITLNLLLEIIVPPFIAPALAFSVRRGLKVK